MQFTTTFTKLRTNHNTSILAFLLLILLFTLLSHGIKNTCGNRDKPILPANQPELSVCSPGSSQTMQSKASRTLSLVLN